jgi:hypothetical protein
VGLALSNCTDAPYAAVSECAGDGWFVNEISGRADGAAKDWSISGFIIVEGRGLGAATFLCVGAGWGNANAGPSTALRSAQDDSVMGSGMRLLKECKCGSFDCATQKAGRSAQDDSVMGSGLRELKECKCGSFDCAAQKARRSAQDDSFQV